jgi:hypothetical protein
LNFDKLPDFVATSKDVELGKLWWLWWWLWWLRWWLCCCSRKKWRDWKLFTLIVIIIWRKDGEWYQGRDAE